MVFHHTFFAIYIFETDKVQCASEALSSVFCIIGCVVLHLKSGFTIPVIILGGYAFVSISVGVWENGGIYSSEIGWYIITIFSITVALSRKVGIYFYVFSFAFLFFMGIMEYAGVHEFSKDLLNNGKNYAYLSCFSVFAIIGLIIFFVFSTENLNNIWKQEKERKISILEVELSNQLEQEKVNSLNFTKQLIESTEAERKRIASDLHDSVSHELLNLKNTFHQDSSTVNDKIDSIINDIRIISRNLHPVMFDKIGLVPNIEQLVERIQTQNDFLVSTEINYSGSLGVADELQIYRIMQEALTNIIKYANAYAAKITMIEMNDKIFIEIKDNGKGFEVKETLNSGKSFGLHNIIERSRVIGGIAAIQSSATGTIITVNIPKKVQNALAKIRKLVS
ncbi:MAG: sensor histidine kinase [Arcicella sp.]|nr:sensor histidine kinase [Arcicella sp.]